MQQVDICWIIDASEIIEDEMERFEEDNISQKPPDS